MLKLIFRVFSFFYVFVIITISISKLENIELSDNYFSSKIYLILIITTLILVIASLALNAAEKSETNGKGLLNFVPYIVGSITLIILFNTVLNFEFGGWVNNKIIFENVQNRNRTINHQLFDKGALGFGGERIVEVSPFLKLWNKVKVVDTVNLTSKEWQKKK